MGGCVIRLVQPVEGQQGKWSTVNLLLLHWLVSPSCVSAETRLTVRPANLEIVSISQTDRMCGGIWTSPPSASLLRGIYHRRRKERRVWWEVRWGIHPLIDSVRRPLQQEDPLSANWPVYTDLSHAASAVCGEVSSCSLTGWCGSVSGSSGSFICFCIEWGEWLLRWQLHEERGRLGLRWSNQNTNCTCCTYTKSI